ncbi:UDP-glucose 4-epimerase GalE [Paenibacillus alvei]|uniref:UDP-glucose 4-epimerase n=1 Tax=Paenibacillus alvei TaxID=44250 RepID=D6QW56_PAEAL|nr:UDP-glucose 4-epimerase GalE [Paenibacillus alvei]ADG29285.1 putative UDP-glucose 4-epimerase [Paenibacillus alvei]EJW18359.1 UDP-glucose 4-epimerase GalE [Paenibacillus alvei DSM 29]MCY9540328.1 UDP-glucose 4-epimerase GalE [Paenibacillus alvei]MCY9703059.1 UDP-glucose 4-epimerase GalE [Paenibacillus alvei]MCY9735718.1 UDP-glucose 4-epimerase GalE [Paenibacillus alvei]
MSILVTGGAGYIGSHTVQALLEQEEQVIVVDNLSTGHQNAVKNVELVQCDIRDKEALGQVFRKYNIEAVVHFAASSLVGESMQNPGKYYDNNLYGTLCLLEIMVQHGVTKIVFSSTAATYGNPEIIPITESEATKPTNAYGETKLAMESMMQWFDIAHGLKYVALRYFNAAGAHENGIIGEDHQPETHLIPLILQVPLGKRDYISVFGNDYDTADGTCIRDYIHVRDLADAHIKSIYYLKSGGESAIFNLGNGNGYSVLEMINAARAVTGHPIPAKMEERRAGDPAVLVANAQKSREILKWEPKWTSIEEIIYSAWKWHSANPNGYER